jgi:hypothetical protein
MLQKLAQYLLPALAFLVLINPMLGPGIPHGHDTINHLARFANYKLALKEGQIPPRLAPNLMNRYGYPVFNYNYPLPNILSVPFTAVGFHYETTFALINIGAFAVGAVGMWLWLKLLKVRSTWAKNLAISTYLLSPYAVNVVFVRGNIGEALAMNLIVWLAVLIELVKQQRFKLKNCWHFLGAVLVLTMFLLSHNISTMFGTGIMIIYGLARGLKVKDWKKLLTVFSFGFGLTLWFWLPAIAEKHLIVLDNVDLTKNFAKHFPRLEQLMFAPLFDGLSYEAPVDGISFALGKPLLLVLFLTGLLLLVDKLQSNFKLKSELALFFGITFLMVLLQLPTTEFLWNIMPLANYIQFPWRLGMFTAIFGAILTGLSFIRLKAWGKLLIITALLLQLVSTAKFRGADKVQRSMEDYDCFVESTTTLNENRPKTFKYKDIWDWSPTPKIMKGYGEIAVDYWFGSKRAYNLILEQESIIVEPTMNFPGWETEVNGVLVEYVDDESIQGRLAYVLPEGKYQVQSRFKQKTWSRLVGNSLFVITVLLVGFYIHRLQNEK